MTSPRARKKAAGPCCHSAREAVDHRLVVATTTRAKATAVVEDRRGQGDQHERARNQSDEARRDIH